MAMQHARNGKTLRQLPGGSSQGQAPGRSSEGPGYLSSRGVQSPAQFCLITATFFTLAMV